MELSELLHAARQLLDDEGGYTLTDDETLVRHFNSAVREACLRTRKLQDDSSYACRVTLVPGQARYDLEPEVLVVRAAFVPDRREPLILTKASRLDIIAPGWAHQAQQNSTPRYAVFDVGQKTITVQPPPALAGEMHLRVWRLPFETEEFEVGDDDVEPAVLLPNQEALKYWVAFEIFSQKDSELEDPDRAARNYTLFEATYGPRPSNHDLELWSTSRIVGQRMHSEF